MSKKIDGVLEQVGAFGWYQMLQQLMFGTCNVIAAFHFLAIVFHSITPDFRCKLPGWDNDTYGIQSGWHNESINAWIPRDEEGHLQQCVVYTDIYGNDSSTAECSSYVFSKEVYWGKTLNMEFNLVCAQSGIETVVKVVFTVGQIAGAIIVGMLADRFGRKKALIGTMFVGGAAGVAAAFSVHIGMYAGLRFVIAFCYTGTMLLVHIGIMEITAPSKRALAILIKTPSWATGFCIMCLLAYYIQDWNWLQLATSVPSIVMGIIMIFFLEETPHFLVTKGEHERAVQVFAKMARVNKKTLPKDILESMKEDEEEAQKERLTAIVKAPVLVKRSLVFFYLWFITGMGYYGLTFNAKNLVGSIYLNTFLLTVIELPSGLAGYFSAVTGRKPLSLTVLFLGAGCLTGVAFMYVLTDLTDNLYSTVLTVVMLVGKLCLTILFMFDYLWSSEVFPTTLRGSLVGFSSLMARVGSVLAPVIVDVKVDTPFGVGFGPLLFGITMLIGGVLAFYLPETNQQKLPETISEANTFKSGSRKSKTGADVEMVGYTSSKADLISEKF